MANVDPHLTADWNEWADAPSTVVADTGRYEFGAVIAQGGMGVVIRARDRNLNREIAIKLVHAHLRDRPNILRRFQEEAEVLSQLQHPGIVPVHEVGTLADGRPFFAMKLVVGRTLGELLRDRPPDDRQLGRFLPIFESICQTVAYAHSRGIIHRDLKPANVMVGEFGEVQVMDWGLAKESVAQDTRDCELTGCKDEDLSCGDDASATRNRDESATGEARTTAGEVVGTPAYMPPEQARGEIEKVGPPADVFALGGILCTMLTGQPPFVSESADILAASRAGKLSSAWERIRASGADTELIDIGVHCLQPEPSARPRNAGELVGLIAAYRAGVEERMRAADRRRAEAEAEAREQRKRRKTQLALAAAVGFLLLGGGAFAWWADRQATHRRNDEQRRTQEVQELKTRNADAVAALLDQCKGHLENGDADRAALPLQLAERRFAEGGCESIEDRLLRCRADLDTLRVLDRLDEMLWSPERPRSLVEHAIRWKQDFVQLGIVPGQTALDEIRSKVLNSNIRDAWIHALDQWLTATPPNAEMFVKAQLEREKGADFVFASELLPILHAVDPDPYRDAIRAAIANWNGIRFEELLAQPELLKQPSRFTSAIAHCRKAPLKPRQEMLIAALSQRPDDFNLLMTLGTLYDTKNIKILTASAWEKWLRAAVAIRPENASARNSLGVSLSAQGNEKLAIVEYKKAIQLDAKNYIAYRNLGLSHQTLHDSDAALAALNESIRLNPEYAEAHRDIGILLLESRNDLDGAISAFEKAIRCDPNVERAHSFLGCCLDRKNDFAAAIPVLREAIRLNPTSPQNRYNLGATLFRSGERAAGIASMREAVRLAPEDPAFHENLARVLSDSGDVEGAIAASKEALRLDPKLTIAQSILDQASKRQKQSKVTIDSARAAVQSDPKNPENHFDLGRVLGPVDREAAIASLREAIRLNSNHVAAHNELRHLLHGKGDLKGAIEAARSTVRLAPKSAIYWWYLGGHLFEAGELDAAIDGYRRAVDLNPKLGYITPTPFRISDF